MKIARQPRILASTPMNGKTSLPPRTPKNHPPADEIFSGRVIDVMGSRERLGCTIQRAAQKPQDCGRFSSPLRKLKNRFLLPFIERHSLSQPFGLPAPSEREPGTACTIQPAAWKPQDFGRFSSPLRNSGNFGFYHSSDDTPSVSPSGCQLPQRGSRE